MRSCSLGFGWRWRTMSHTAQYNTNLSFLPHPLGQRDNLLVKESSLLHQSLLILRPHSLLSMMMMVFWFRWLLSLDPPVCSSQCRWSSGVPQCQLAACQWWTRGSWCAGRLWSPSPGALRSDHPWIPTFTHFQLDFQLSQIFHTHTHTHTHTYLDSSLISSSLHLMTSPRFSFSTRSSLFSSWTIFDGVRSPGMFSTSSRISPMKAARVKRLGMFPLWS